MEGLRKRNGRVLMMTLGVVAFMAALSFASAPLYRLVCKVTGWEGTTQRAEAVRVQPMGREITVRFNADTAPGLPWVFFPEQGPVMVRIGADRLVSFAAENRAGRAVAGTAVYNVTPLAAGRYFFKTQCFCFGEQVLAPGQKVHMPVVFYIDPKIAEDPDLKDIRTITLSYTFYPKDSAALEQATQKFYNDNAGWQRAKTN